MVTRGATNGPFKDRGTAVERMSRSPFLAAVTPIGGAIDVSMPQVITMRTEARRIRGVEMVAEFDLQFLKEFKCSFDEECVQQVGFNLLADRVFDAKGFESSQLKVRMINEMNRAPCFAIEGHRDDEAV